MANSTRKAFQLHRKMIEDIIMRQAGTLEKAVLEAAMNSAEAGSPKFEITFVERDGKYILRMRDWGRGIDSKEKLEEYFETFGTPHQATENKTWAKFRVGRGQCFAQGKNTWRTCKFVMSTDVVADIEAQRDIGYSIRDVDEFFDGCEIEIELYDNRWYGSVDRLRDSVKTQLEFMQMDIVFNGEKLNRDPAKLNWTHEDEYAYYLFGAGDRITIYNLGVRCQTIDAASAGCVGIIVSKQLFDVNFARNEILTSCPVYQHVQQIIALHRVKKSRSPQKRLDRDERTATLRAIRYGEIDVQSVMNTGLFYTTSGRSLTLRDLINCRIPWSFGDEGDRLCDKLIQSDQALIVDGSVLDSLGYDGDEREFFSWVLNDRRDDRFKLMENLHQSVDVLKGRYSSHSSFIPRDKWTKFERRLVRVLEGLRCWNDRAILIAVTDHDGYTDGSSFIAISRKFIENCSCNSMWGAPDLFALLTHELAHNDNSQGTHIHGEEFYREFHDIVNSPRRNPFKFVGSFVERMKDAKKDEHTSEIIARQRKAEEKLAAALEGKTAARSSGSAHMAAFRGRRRRMPTGAE